METLTFGHAMKPSRLQCFFRRYWPVQISLAAGALACAVAAGRACEPSPALFFQWPYLLLFVLLVLMALPVGWFATFLLWALFLGPLYHAFVFRKGSPFRLGDEVGILVGPHRDRIARVYEVWPERHQVRVDLGDQESNDVKDVFSFSEIWREKSAEQDAAPNGGPATRLGNSGVTEGPPSVS